MPSRPNAPVRPVALLLSALTAALLCPSTVAAAGAVIDAAAAAAASVSAAPGAAAGSAGFGFDDVARLAAALASAPYRSPSVAAPQFAALTYDDYRQIRFKPEHGVWRGTGLPWQVQFFPAGRGFNHALAVFEVADGGVRPVAVAADAFESDGPPLPAAATGAAAVAGLRLLNPFNDGSRWDEVIAFLGASYFRALGTGQRYGASARGIAVDTVGGNGEEFPAFTRFWLERPTPGAAAVVLHALLDGPRVAGAYRFTVRPGVTTTVDVQARLYLRGPVAMLGIAPLSSMFLAGENQPASADFRPEVHDSDGLQLALADGEWVWRPLTNPNGSFVTSFATRSPRGFGLMQRDRRFFSYEDLEAHYERRPSVWVEPVGDWGAGRVELLQFHTPDETHDNVAAYWVPDRLPAAGQPLDIAWRLHWAAAAAPRPPGSAVVQTRVGHGWRSTPPTQGEMQLHIDFDAAPTPPVDPLTGSAAPAPATAVEPVVSANANVRGLRAIAQPNTASGGWRVTLDFERIDAGQPVELRAFLRRGGQTLSETWSYALAPQP